MFYMRSRPTLVLSTVQVLLIAAFCFATVCIAANAADYTGLRGRTDAFTSSDTRVILVSAEYPANTRLRTTRDPISVPREVLVIGAPLLLFALLGLAAAVAALSVRMVCHPSASVLPPEPPSRRVQSGKATIVPHHM